MAKKTAKKAVKLGAVVMYYASKDKYLRAIDLVQSGKCKTIKEAYLSLGGLITDHGYAQV